MERRGRRRPWSVVGIDSQISQASSSSVQSPRATRLSPRLHRTAPTDTVSPGGPTVVVSQVGGRNNSILNMFNRAAPPRVREGERAPAPAEAAGSSSSSHPPMADMERVRALKRKAPEGPRGRNAAPRITKQTAIPITQRLAEFPNEGFKESAGKIFCRPCKEEVQNLKEGLKRHIKSSKHKKRSAAWRRANIAGLQLNDDLANFFKEHPDLQGVSLLTG